MYLKIEIYYFIHVIGIVNLIRSNMIDCVAPNYFPVAKRNLMKFESYLPNEYAILNPFNSPQIPWVFVSTKTHKSNNKNSPWIRVIQAISPCSKKTIYFWGSQPVQLVMAAIALALEPRQWHDTLDSSTPTPEAPHLRTEGFGQFSSNLDMKEKVNKEEVYYILIW